VKRKWGAARNCKRRDRTARKAGWNAEQRHGITVFALRNLGAPSALVNNPAQPQHAYNAGMGQRIGLILIGDELLSGKRRDEHLDNAARIGAERGLDIDWVRIEHDELARLTGVFRETMDSGDIVFSYGGIGATPDDVTRPAAAAAAGVPLVRHPGIAGDLEKRYGDEAHPYRIRMAEIPEGCRGSHGLIIVGCFGMAWVLAG